MILAGASLENTCKRGEILRKELKLLQVQHGGQTLGNIMLSIGVATYPAHASDAETLVKAAEREGFSSLNRKR